MIIGMSNGKMYEKKDPRPEDIARMNYNALCIKALTMAMVLFSLDYGRPDAGLIAAVGFGFLDMHYLGLERKMRGKSGWTILSPSVWGYYGLIILIILFIGGR